MKFHHYLTLAASIAAVSPVYSAHHTDTVKVAKAYAGFPVTVSVIQNPESTLNAWLNRTDDDLRFKDFKTIAIITKNQSKPI